MAPIPSSKWKSGRNAATIVKMHPVCAAAPPGPVILRKAESCWSHPNKCIGCGACIASCPYDARYPHPEDMWINVPSVQHRIKKGLKPACAAVCPTKCMYFGDLDDPNSEVSVVLKKRKSKTLIPEAGTKPSIIFSDLEIA